MMKSIPAICLLPLFFASCGDADKTSGKEEQTLLAKGQEEFNKAKIEAERVKQGAEEAMAPMIEWTRKAAEKGHKDAQIALSGLYYFGRNELPRQAEKAKEWFEKAAAQGWIEARYYLGRMYAEGDGVKRDMDEALRQWSIAAQGGIAEAQYQLGLFYIQGKETFEQGIYWLKQAANGTVADASLALGKIYANGLGPIQPQKQEAAKWYRQAAEYGNKQGQFIYGLMCMEGAGTAKDEKQGFSYIQFAAGQDYLPAVHQLIRCYKEGIGTPVDEDKARAWEQRAQELEARQPE